MVLAKLPSYMVPSSFVLVDEFPLTAHGKIDRARLAAVHPASRTTRPRRPSFNETEQRLVRVWEEVFDTTGIDSDDDFFDLGGDSLTGAVMSARVQAIFGLELQLETIFDNSVLCDLATTIDELRSSSAETESVPDLARTGTLPLTYNQESHWLFAQTTVPAAALTMSRCSRILGPLDEEILSHCISTMVRRHEMLRTSFSIVGGEPVQIVHPPPNVPLPLHDVADEPDVDGKAREVWKSEAARVFDLTKPPLICFALIRLRVDEHWLVYTAHCILVDGVSWSIFFRELGELYEAKTRGREVKALQVSPQQYGEYAIWQRQSLHPQNDRYGEALTWWTSYLLEASFPVHPTYRKAVLWCMDRMRLKDRFQKQAVGGILRQVLRPPLPPRTELPFRRADPKPDVDPGEGLITCNLKTDIADRLSEFERQQGATAYMTRLAAFVAILAAETGDPNVVLYTSLSNRDHPATRNVFGCCATPVILIFNCEGRCSFREFVAVVRNRLLGMQAHADLPYDRLYREMRAWKVKMPQGLAILGVARGHPTISCVGVTISRIRDWSINVKPTMFTVLLDAASDEKEENCRVAFDASVYETAQIRKFVHRFIALLDVVSRQPDIGIDDAIALAQKSELNTLN
jgi:hypothetical protein